LEEKYQEAGITLLTKINCSDMNSETRI